MPTEVIMPALGMAQETGKVIRWLRLEGEAVTKGEPLIEIETDKVTVELEAPASGVLAAVTAAEGADVPVGHTIAQILADGESGAAASPSPVTVVVAAAPELVAVNGLAAVSSGRRRPLASPKARRLAQELGVDLAQLAGSGPGGAVVAADVTSASSETVAEEVSETGVAASALWRTMATRMTSAWTEIPHFYLVREVDASRLRSWRATYPAEAGVTYTDLLVRLAAAALREHPRVNGAWVDGTLVTREAVSIGLAVALEDGLVVPVLHDADRASVRELARRRVDLVERARAGSLRLDDVQGGTFTITNLGMLGVDAFNAIVVPGQAAILAIGRIADRVVPEGGVPVVRPMLVLTLSCDHRAVDGARAAAFLDRLATLVEEPAALID